MAPRKTTTRTPRSRSAKINDAETLKDTQQINEQMSESLGTQVSPGSVLYQKGQFQVDGRPDILGRLYKPSQAAVDAKKASDEYFKNYGTVSTTTKIVLPEGKTEGTWSISIPADTEGETQNVLLDELEYNVTAQSLQSKISDLGHQGVRVTRTGNEITIVARFGEPTADFSNLTEPAPVPDPEG